MKINLFKKALLTCIFPYIFGDYIYPLPHRTATATILIKKDTIYYIATFEIGVETVETENNRNEYLIYTLESLIEIGKRKVSDLSKIAVYKYLYLAYLKLKPLGIDIQLPYSWYYHGTMIEGRGFSYHTGGLMLSNYFFEGFSAVNYYGASSSLSIRDEDKYTITSTLEDLLTTYSHSQHTDIPKLIKDVYAHAPYDFQREFKEKLVWCKPVEFKANLLKSLDSLKHAFPREKFADIYPQYLRWDDTMRLALKRNVSTEELFELRNEFWKCFASFLRSRENENVTDAEQEQMVKFAEKKKENLNAFLYDIREKYILTQDAGDEGMDDNGNNSSLLDKINSVAYSAFISER